MHWRDIIRRPVVTEKSNMVSALDQYTFVVDPRANKIQIKEAVELAWPDVTVSRVRVANMPSKRARGWRRRGMRTRKPGWKKAVVTLSSGRIELFEGVG
jgi:large subunit ribosomal protein L23